jgi:hypothetical protein
MLRRLIEYTRQVATAPLRQVAPVRYSVLPRIASRPFVFAIGDHLWRELGSSSSAKLAANPWARHDTERSQVVAVKEKTIHASRAKNRSVSDVSLIQV